MPDRARTHLAHVYSGYFFITAGRERTFEGVPIYGGGGRRYNKSSKYAKMAAEKSSFLHFQQKW